MTIYHYIIHIHAKPVNNLSFLSAKYLELVEQ